MPTHPASLALGLALAIGLASSACASRSEAEPGASGHRDGVYVTAVNENYYDARVHAVYDGGQRETLGTIPGNGGTVEVVLPWEPRSLTFEVSFIVSGEEYVSKPVAVDSGEHIDLRLPANIEMSGFFRRVARE